MQSPPPHCRCSETTGASNTHPDIKVAANNTEQTTPEPKTKLTLKWEGHYTHYRSPSPRPPSLSPLLHHCGLELLLILNRRCGRVGDSASEAASSPKSRIVVKNSALPLYFLMRPLRERWTPLISAEFTVGLAAHVTCWRTLHFAWAAVGRGFLLFFFFFSPFGSTLI